MLECFTLIFGFLAFTLRMVQLMHLCLLAVNMACMRHPLSNTSVHWYLAVQALIHLNLHAYSSPEKLSSIHNAYMYFMLKTLAYYAEGLHKYTCKYLDVLMWDIEKITKLYNCIHFYSH